MRGPGLKRGRRRGDQGSLLLLDLDGTLVDSFADIRSGIAHALASIDIAPTEELLSLCRLGVGLEVFYERAVGRDPAAPAEAAALAHFATSYRQHYLTHQSQTRAYDGVADALRWVRDERPEIAVTVATAKRTDMAEQVIDACGLGGLFDLVQGSEDLPAKPDPAVLRRVAARVGLSLGQATMVGDTDRDVGAARRAGCRAIAVTYGGFTRAELEPLTPDHLIDHFAELCALL